MTFGGRFVLNIIHFAALQGVSLSDMLKLSGYSEKQLELEETRVEASVFSTIVEEAVFKSGDAYFGLHAGEQLNLAAAGLIAQITQTSRTVKEALSYCCEFAMLGCRSIPLELVLMGSDYKLSLVADRSWAQQSPLAVRQTVEGLLAFTLREFHTLSHRKNHPVLMHFDFDQPSDPSEYQRLFQCPLLFNQQETAFFFKQEDVEQNTITSDYNLLRVLVAHAREKLDIISSNQGFQYQVRQSVLKLMNPEFPSLEKTASNLNLSVRSLQRKLSSEDQTYKAIIEDLRKDFALGYLKNSDLQINEVAYLLSYAESSAFIRSFKRWTGFTPQQYKNTQTSFRA